MQICQVANRDCFPNQEIEYFLRIQELSQVIIIANTKLKNSKDIYGKNRLKNLINIADDKLDHLVNDLAKFGLTNPLDYFKDDYSDEFCQWYAWWEKYLATLNQVELGDLEKSYINGEDLSEWYPKDSWK